MPRADVGDEGSGFGGGKKGEFRVVYAGIADKTMKPKDPDSTFKESLRVGFKVDGTEDVLSLSVQVDDPADDLWGFVPNSKAAPAGDEGALRAFIDQNVIHQPIIVYVSKNFIKSRLALEGEHTFVRLIGAWGYEKDAGPRVGMTAVTSEGLTTTFNCRDPKLEKRKGQTPDDDYIGPDGALNQDQTVFTYFQAFGLKWDLMKKDLMSWPAYWPGHWDNEGLPIEPLFPSLENPWPGFIEMIDRHGTGNPVKMEIVRHATYGLGPKRTGKFPVVKMTVVEAGTVDKDRQEFDDELASFGVLYDTLTTAIFDPDGKQPDGVLFFDAVGTLTEKGRDVVKGVIKPLVLRYPDASKVRKGDGSVGVGIPPSFDTWTLNGLVCANRTAELLLRLEKDERFEVVNLTDPATLFAWVDQHVMEWQNIAGEKEEIL